METVYEYLTEVSTEYLDEYEKLMEQIRLEEIYDI